MLKGMAADSNIKQPQYPWLVLLSAFLCIFIGTSYGYVVGVLHVALLEQYQESVILTAWLGSVFCAVFCLAAPVGSLLTNNASSRVCVVTGAVLNLVGLALSSLSPNLPVLFLTYGVIAGAGQSFEYVGSVAAIGYYFKERRTLAIGVAVMGCGLGTVVFPPLTQILLDLYSLDGTFLIIAAIAFQSCVFGALLRPHPLEIKRKTSTKSNQQISKWKIINELKSHITLFGNRSFLFFCLSIFCWSSAISICILYMPDYFISRGVSTLEASMLMSSFGLGSAVSRILTGTASVDGGLDRKIIYFGSFAILGVMSFCANGLIGSVFGRLFLSFELGLYSAGAWVLLNQLAIDIVGLQHFVTAVGDEMFIAGVGSLVGPLLASACLQKELLNQMFNFSGIAHNHICICRVFFFMLTSGLGIMMVLYLPSGIKDIEKQEAITDSYNRTLEVESFLNNKDNDYTITVK